MAERDSDQNQVHSIERTVATFQSPSSASPVLARELVALVLLVLLCDLTVYRSAGFAGPGVFFLAAPVLLGLGTVRLKGDRRLWVLVPLLILLAVRLLWCGSFLAIVVGGVLLCCFAMGLAGMPPYLTRAFVFASQLIAAGYRGLNHYFRTLSRFSPAILRTQWFAVALPLMALVTFALIFIMANPDLVTALDKTLSRWVESLELWLRQFQFSEILFCAGAGWLATGLLRPDQSQGDRSDPASTRSEALMPSPYYEAYRNTLAVVIGLFALYLIFEFQTLWFKTFPKGFHYSGYAHEGAAWLTVALGLATMMLSLFFRGSILTDPRVSRLRVLSWIWSMENLLLAIAVFNRLFIYIGFNGMTRMRVVGILGVASVVVGFLLVLRKIARNHHFTWLIRRQLWTVGFAAYLYAVLPVDGFVNQFNVHRILNGDPRPSVQISVHPTTEEGWLYLKPLIDCQDPIIRDGIRGLLEEKRDLLERETPHRQQLGWTARQFAVDRLFAQLKQTNGLSLSEPERKETDSQGRQAAVQKFHEYAYQWY